MAISDSIQRFTSKARDVAGAVSAISDFPGIPENIRSSIQSIFGTGTGLPPSSNRRDLNNFLGATSKLNGFTRPSYFYIEIAPPPMLRDEVETARNLAFLCESTNLPGVAFASSDIKRYGYGPIEKKPYRITKTIRNAIFYRHFISDNKNPSCRPSALIFNCCGENT